MPDVDRSLHQAEEGLKEVFAEQSPNITPSWRGKHPLMVLRSCAWACMIAFGTRSKSASSVSCRDSATEYRLGRWAEAHFEAEA